MVKRKGVHPSRDGKTVGITLRIPIVLLAVYDKIAARANLIDLKKGGAGRLTTQDVMRHRLASLPLMKRQGDTDD